MQHEDDFCVREANVIQSIDYEETKGYLMDHYPAYTKKNGACFFEQEEMT